MSYDYDRRVILAAMKGWKDLPEDTYVTIGKYRGGVAVEFTGADGKSVASLKGHVELEKSDPECGRTFTMSNSEAPHGWGPFLYDLALEHVYPRGVIPDRMEVSRAALSVWNYYLNSRSDVRKEVIPDPDCEAPAPREALEHIYYKKPDLLRKGGDKLILR